jgi:hypothetical protein
MPFSQKPQTIIDDEENANIASDSFYDGNIVLPDLNPMVGCPDHNIPDTNAYSIDKRQLRNVNHTQSGTPSFDQTCLLPSFAGARFAEWDTSMAMPSTEEGRYTHGKNKQFADTTSSRCQDAVQGGHSMYHLLSENTGEDNVASGRSQVLQSYTSMDSNNRYSQNVAPTREVTTTTNVIRCWLHHCDGRSFTHLGNYRRHCREKSGLQMGVSCSLCGKHFTRRAAWKIHTNQQKCKFIDYDANGIPFERKRRSKLDV